MSLTHEQRYLLEELREYLRRVEKMAARYQLDLDAFATEYSETAYAFAASEKSPVKERATHRRAIFQKAGQHENISIYLPEEEWYTGTAVVICLFIDTISPAFLIRNGINHEWAKSYELYPRPASFAGLYFTFAKQT